MPRSLILLLLFGCHSQTKSTDIWSAGQLLKELQDKNETLPCVSDPALYLRVLWPKLDKSPMPKDHLCQQDLQQCIQEARNNFCESELLEEIEREKELFRIP